MLGILVKMHLDHILTSKNRQNILKEYTYGNDYESHGVVPHEGLHGEYVTLKAKLFCFQKTFKSLSRYKKILNHLMFELYKKMFANGCTSKCVG